MNDTELPRFPGDTQETCDNEDGADPRFAAAEDGVRALLAAIGENPGRDGLKETPARVVRASPSIAPAMRRIRSPCCARRSTRCPATRT